MIDIRERLAQNKGTAPRKISPPSLPDQITIPDNMLELVEEEEKFSSGLEQNARRTLLRMFNEVPQMDEPFVFKVIRNGGKAYVQAMRSVLGKVRREAREEHRQLKKFKFILMEINHLPTHDEVTVMRTQRASLKEKNIYDELIATLAVETEIDNNGNAE